MCVLVTAVVSIGAFTYRRERMEWLQTTCADRLFLLGANFGRYVEERGEMPYAAEKPHIVDPSSFEGFDSPWCPVLRKFSERRMLDSGYRMFNWRRETWAFVVGHVFSVNPSQTRAQVVCAGAPVAWCAEPAHDGKRNVLVVPPEGWDPTSERCFGITYVYRMSATEFEAKMQEVAEAVAAMSACDPETLPGGRSQPGHKREHPPVAPDR